MPTLDEYLGKLKESYALAKRAYNAFKSSGCVSASSKRKVQNHAETPVVIVWSLSKLMQLSMELVRLNEFVNIYMEFAPRLCALCNSCIDFALKEKYLKFELQINALVLPAQQLVREARHLMISKFVDLKKNTYNMNGLYLEDGWQFDANESALTLVSSTSKPFKLNPKAIDALLQDSQPTRSAGADATIQKTTQTPREKTSSRTFFTQTDAPDPAAPTIQKKTRTVGMQTPREKTPSSRTFSTQTETPAPPIEVPARSETLDNNLKQMDAETKRNLQNTEAAVEQEAAPSPQEQQQTRPPLPAGFLNALQSKPQLKKVDDQKTLAPLKQQKAPSSLAERIMNDFVNRKPLRPTPKSSQEPKPDYAYNGDPMTAALNSARGMIRRAVAYDDDDDDQPESDDDFK